MPELPAPLRAVRDRVLAECERHSVAQVKAMLATGHWNLVERGTAETWLACKQAELEDEQRQLENRAVIAAERAAESSRDAANSARNSARWTLLATIIALLALAASVIPGCIQRL